MQEPLTIAVDPRTFLGPDLPDPACAGRWSLFDPPAPDEHPDDLAYRRTAARTLCASCTALTACRRIADTFAAHRGSAGFVIAGRVLRPT